MDSKDGMNVAEETMGRNKQLKRPLSPTNNNLMQLQQPSVPKLRPNRFSPAPWYESQSGATNYELPGSLKARLIMAVKEYCCVSKK